MALETVELPSGFEIELYAEDLTAARSMALGGLLQLPDGSLLVSDDRQGANYRITYRGE